MSQKGVSMVHMLTAFERESLETYQKLAPHWGEHRTLRWRDQNWYNFVALLPGKRILDLGCGVGDDVEFFLPFGYEYFGIDISSGMLAVAQDEYAPGIKKGLLHFMQMSMYELAFRDSTFDGAWAITSYMHIPRGNLLSVLKETWRVLKPGGPLFISIPRGTHSGMWAPDHGYGKTLSVCWESKQLLQVLERAGFEIMHAEDVSFMLTILVQKPV